MNIKKYIYKIAISLSLFLSAISANGFYVIVNSNNKIESISSKQVKRIFLGKVTRWDNNEPTVIADYTTSNILRSEFSKEVLGRSSFKVYKIWIRHSLSGKTAPPHYFRDKREVYDYVTKNPGAIGYVQKKETKYKGVKYLSIIQ